ncbi:hypothetical protein ACFL4A_02450 [bacterium]
MNLLLFLGTIIISFLAVRLGAVAFQMTGLEWSVAKFQALSCFSGTGFTTKEAELIVGHKQRRKIASILMITGNAGLVTLIATFANSMKTTFAISKIKIPFLDVLVPVKLIPLINLVVIILFVFLSYKFFTASKISQRITDLLKKKIKFKPVFIEEIPFGINSMGILKLFIHAQSNLLEKEARDLKLNEYDIELLLIERAGKKLLKPYLDQKIVLNDKIVFFGNIKEIKKILIKK